MSLGAVVPSTVDEEETVYPGSDGVEVPKPVPAQVGATVGASYDRGAVPTIKQFMECDAFIRGLMGPFGSGKSSGCVWDIVGRGVRQAPNPRDGVRRSRWVVVRNTYRMLSDTTIRTVHEWFPPHIYGRWTSGDHRYLIDSLMAPGDKQPAQIELLFRALDRPEHVSNLLSLDVTGAWVNEAREVPWAIIDVLQGRVGRYPAIRDGGPSWYGVLMDTNPPDVDSEWYRFFEGTDHSEAVTRIAESVPALREQLEKHGFARIFKQPSGLSDAAENLPNLRAGYYHQLAVGKSPDWVKVYVKGEYGFVIDGKPVFPEYEDSFHSVPFDKMKTVEGVPIYRGWDFGLTPACVFTQLLPNGQWFVADELIASDMGVDQFSDEVLEHSAQYFPRSEFIDVGDPAGMQRSQVDERSCFEILSAKGIAIDGGEQSVQVRLESVRRPLRTVVPGGKPQLVIHPRCDVLRRAMMGGYQYRRLRISGERYSDRPDKNKFSHVADALQYVASRLFGSSLRFGRSPEDEPVERGESDRLRNATRSLVTGY